MSEGKKSWCSSCTGYRQTSLTDLGLICCTSCGKVVGEDLYRDEVTFSKNAAGQSQMQGTYVNFDSALSSSRQRTLDRAYDFILHMIDNLGVTGRDQIAKPSVKLYEIAVEKNFVRGRIAEQVQAACLYIACRKVDKPYLLIEFSEFLRVNVYVLGAVFLQLCKLLHLQEHPIVRKLVDPSLFIHRFSLALVGEEMTTEVANTALRIMTSMKRDWMQTGRKPSGLCGAALYISALSHGFKFSKTDVVRVVHICEATLTKRLIEFEGTESGSLTIEEFNLQAKELENNVTERSIIKSNMSKESELLCQHKGSDVAHFAHGLCEACYSEFIKLSGGLDGGSEPPAFQRAERERLAKASVDKNAKSSLLDADQLESSCNNPTIENVTRVDAIGVGQMETAKSGIEHGALDGFVDISGTADNLGTDDGESDRFSDIDDAEVDAYLHNEEEARYKKMIWEEVNREYIEEQAQKAAAGVLNVPKSKKERQRKKTEGMNAQTAAEAAHQMLSKKRVSSKLNHDKLKELFDESEIFDIPKKSRTENLPEKKNDAEGENGEDESETVDDYDEKNAYEEFHDNPYDYDEEGYEDFDDGLF